MLIEELGGLLALERLAFHDVAPMAGRVTDTEKDGFVFGARLLEGFIAPGEPIDWIVLMLEEVGRFFAREAIGERWCVTLAHDGPLLLRRRRRMLFAGNTDCSQQNERRYPRGSKRHTGTIDLWRTRGNKSSLSCLSGCGNISGVL